MFNPIPTAIKSMGVTVSPMPLNTELVAKSMNNRIVPHKLILR